ncbi:uncharacterized protein LOC130558741 [Triplophysa rosa]|uniref:uncharacterized protein LOC130558741 n=1 Tax=Triplophysa rosa TaxID=992332 RepID=UPI002545D5EF|nr:uncharacterized protein LOC130558741 [Triplophysa rosa]
MASAPNAVDESEGNVSCRWHMTDGGWHRMPCCTPTTLILNAPGVLARYVWPSYCFYMRRSKFPQEFFSYEAEWDFGTYFTFKPLEFPSIYRGNRTANSYLSIEKAGGVESPAPSGVLKWGGVHARDGDRPLLRALYDPPETLDCTVPGQRASKEQIQILLQNSRGAAYCSYTGWETIRGSEPDYELLGGHTTPVRLPLTQDKYGNVISKHINNIMELQTHSSLPLPFWIGESVFQLSLSHHLIRSEAISAQQVSSAHSALLAIMCVTLSSCLAFAQHKLDVSARIS